MVKEILAEVLIKGAMNFEEETRAFYLRCLERESNDRLRELYGMLAEEEKKHKLRLKEVLDSGIDDILDVEERELPTLEEALGVRSGGEETPSEEAYRVLKVALDHEISSYNFYALLGKRSVLSILKKTFHFLAAEEERHIQRIRAMIEELDADDRTT